MSPVVVLDPAGRPGPGGTAWPNGSGSRSSHRRRSPWPSLRSGDRGGGSNSGSTRTSGGLWPASAGPCAHQSVPPAPSPPARCWRRNAGARPAAAGRATRRRRRSLAPPPHRGSRRAAGSFGVGQAEALLSPMASPRSRRGSGRAGVPLPGSAGGRLAYEESESAGPGRAGRSAGWPPAGPGRSRCRRAWAGVGVAGLRAGSGEPGPRWYRRPGCASVGRIGCMTSLPTGAPSGSLSLTHVAPRRGHRDQPSTVSPLLWHLPSLLSRIPIANHLAAMGYTGASSRKCPLGPIGS
jgi:hypothetical protein